MNIHFIGSAGVSMQSLARIARSAGHNVSGSDKRCGGHDKNNILGKDLVVYSGAIPADNEELSFARESGVFVMERADFLCFTAKQFERTIAIAGCHGKTTTTAMTGEVFACLSPTVHLGGEYDFAAAQGKKYFITEACEYRRSFLHLFPDVGIITNVDFDHPDTYANIEEVVEAFRAFCCGCGAVVYNGDDAMSRKAVVKGISYGFGADNDYVVRPFGGGFDLYYHDKYAGAFKLGQCEPFNVKNAAAAVVAGYLEGVCYNDIRAGIERFSGVRNRGEIVQREDGCVVISDYSHHPTEIKQRIAALEKQYGEVAVIFQPHTYSRTIALKKQFATAFEHAAETVFLPTYAARGDRGDDTLIYRMAKPKCKCSFAEKNVAADEFARLKEKYACVVVMGAGDARDIILKNINKTMKKS